MVFLPYLPKNFLFCRIKFKLFLLGIKKKYKLIKKGDQSDASTYFNL